MDDKTLTLRGSLFAMIHEQIYRHLTVNLCKSTIDTCGEAHKSSVFAAVYIATLGATPASVSQKYMTDSLLLFKDAC
jgi:hypothetical protein